MTKIISKNWRVTKNKFLEIELFYSDEPSYSFVIMWEWTRKTDHAGLKLWHSLFGLHFDISFYDHRHWDGFLKTWESCKKGDCPLEDEEDIYGC